jgi:hypothetical protein
MALTFEVYNPTNTTYLGTLSAMHGIGFDADVRVPGSLVFNVDLASTADIALLSWRNVIRVKDGANWLEAYVVADSNSDYVSDDEIPTRSYECPHILSWLGYDKGGAVLWPQGGTNGLQQSPRWFGPQGWDWDEPAGLPEPTTDGPLTRLNWPDVDGERFVFNERAEYRRVLTGDINTAGVQTAIFFTTAWWTEARFYLDGAEINTLSTPVGDVTIRMFGFMYDGQDHVVYIDAHGDPPTGRTNSLGFVWAKATVPEDSDYTLDFDYQSAMYRSFNTTTFGGSNWTLPVWRANEDYADGDRWGVTVGLIMKTAVDEAQSRGLLTGMTYNFDQDIDSYGEPWAKLFVRSIGPEKLGSIVDSLAEFDCEPTISAEGLFSIFQLRGADRTATVTIDVPFALSASDRGPVATRYFVETQEGFDQRPGVAIEAALGTAMEEFLSLGDDVALYNIKNVIDIQQGKDSGVESTYEVDVPPDVVPYVDFKLGDRVTTQSTQNPATKITMRVLQLRCQVDDENGTVSWTTQLEPWS